MRRCQLRIRHSHEATVQGHSETFRSLHRPQGGCSPAMGQGIGAALKLQFDSSAVMIIGEAQLNWKEIECFGITVYALSLKLAPE